MTSKAATVAEYLSELPAERRATMEQLRKTVLDNLPAGFAECMQYGMISFVVPHSIYPAGYHCDAKQPLPFLSIAAQKDFYAFYHMGIYANAELMHWFTESWPRHTTAKLDMGKSCIRFKKPENIPYTLLAELVTKVSVENWICLYESAFRSGRKE